MEEKIEKLYKDELIKDFEFCQLKSGILIEKYKILIDFLKYHYARRQNVETIFLAINTIIISGGAYILGAQPLKTKLLLVPLCIIGILASLVWLAVSERISVDANLKCFQLRDIERKMCYKDGIFRLGYDFFFKSKTLQSSDERDKIEFPKGIIGVLSKFRVRWIDRALPLIFIGLYIYIVICVIPSICTSAVYHYRMH